MLPSAKNMAGVPLMRKRWASCRFFSSGVSHLPSLCAAVPRSIAGAWAPGRESGAADEERGAPGPGLTLFDGLRRYLAEA